jgi:excinuclease ABC subunit B
MLQAAEALEFERAAAIRDRITHMRDAIGEPISAVREQSGGFKGRGKKGKRGRVPRPKADG